MGDQKRREELIQFARTQQAAQTPFDNSTNGFTATEVQAAIEEISGNLVLLNVACDASVFVKAAVRMDATAKAFNAIATALATSNVIGIVIAKPTAILCNIQVIGNTPAIFAGLDPTKELFLSDLVAGNISSTAPADPGEVVVRVGQPFSATEVLVNKGVIIELT